MLWLCKAAQVFAITTLMCFNPPKFQIVLIFNLLHKYEYHKSHSIWSFINSKRNKFHSRVMAFQSCTNVRNHNANVFQCSKVSDRFDFQSFTEIPRRCPNLSTSNMRVRYNKCRTSVCYHIPLVLVRH